MKAWLCIPSARPVDQASACIRHWKAQGYGVALYRDAATASVPGSDINHCASYEGYAKAVNFLAHMVLANDPQAQWIIAAGDDTEPDLNHTADEIAAQCVAHFDGTFGVMQPTGDRWGENPALGNAHPMRTAYIDRVCGSAFIGRTFCERVYGGIGPLWPEFEHMFVDEELMGVATNLGVLWRRRDLIHLHHHWARGGSKQMPGFLAGANSPEHWSRFKRLFESRKAAGFPGAAPLRELQKA